MMIKLYINSRYNELEDENFDYNEVLPDNEIRAEIEAYEREEYFKEREFEDILNHEPQN